jgi:integrase/recombinase XerD
MTRLERTHLPPSAPRPVPAAQVKAVLEAIPTAKDRDRLLFTLLRVTGMRVGEAPAIDVDDLELTPDDEHVTVLGKGGRRRTVLLDDPALVASLRRYLKVRGYRHGPLFRAEKTTSAALCGMPPCRSCGRSTGRKRRCRPRSTNCGTRMPPSWSTPGCP